MTRDPRTDPRAGDCLRKGRFTRVVTQASDEDVCFKSDSRMSVYKEVTIDAWQSWSRDAEIVRVG